MTESQYIKNLFFLEKDIIDLNIEYAASKSTVKICDLVKTKSGKFLYIFSVRLSIINELPNIDYLGKYIDLKSATVSNFDGEFEAVNQNQLHDNYLQEVVNGKVQGVEDYEY